MLKPLFAFSALLFLGQSPQQAPPAPAAWSVPPEMVRMVNPVTPTAASKAQARKMYGYDCALCHGANGNGKGEAVESMKLKVRDYTNAAELKDMTDGEMFYIIKNGKGLMPGEGERLKTNDVWNMVILVRSFARG